MMRKYTILFLMLLGCPLTQMSAQTIQTHQLQQQEFVSVLKQYHPTVKQANWMVARAGMQVRQSRGAFDPLLTTSYEQKTFNDKLYYSYFNPQLTIPTWYGLDIMAGVEEVLGDRAASEKTEGKISYAGVKMSLGNGLLMDKRRGALRQAQGLQALSEAERRLIVNNVLYDGLVAYLNWAKDFKQYTVISDLIRVNEQRLRIVRIEYEQGARAALDTVEVWAQLNSLQQQEQALQMQFQNSGLEVASYMWLEGDVPLPWDGTILPDTNCLVKQFAEINMLQADSLINVARQQHPKLQMLQKKLDVLAIEKRVKTQDLLPKLDLKANLLQKKYDLPKDISTLYMQQNYKVGFDFRMPLFLREARGAVQTTQFKIIETNYELDNTQLQLELKVKSYYNEWVSLKRQLGFFQASYSNNYKLYRGEEARFNIGESTLFVMNSRENKLLETKQKLIELQMKWQKSYVGLLWATGVLQE